ncbi:MAG: alpha/beta fold hydrolase [Planctomycetota bacterium]
MTDASGTRVAFRARDGAPLVGRFFAAEAPVGAVLLGPATGVAARFYRHFAAATAAAGFAVLTFDYRGIGASLEGYVRDVDANLEDWGRRDMPAALDALAGRAPGVPLHLVGHSAGGQLVGLMDNADRLDAVVQVAGSSGWFGGMGRRMRTLGRLLLRVYGPLAVRLRGYAPVRVLGWGEDLPAGVALQWGEWCSTPGYVESAFGRTVDRRSYEALRCRIINVTATDDPIATDTNVEDLLRLFPHAEVSRVRLVPSELGVPSIGHVGFFRPELRTAWSEVWRLLSAVD